MFVTAALCPKSYFLPLLQVKPRLLGQILAVAAAGKLAGSRFSGYRIDYGAGFANIFAARLSAAAAVV